MRGATHTTTMGWYASECRAELCCAAKGAKIWERIEKDGCRCEGGFQKVMFGAAPRNRSNTVGPVVASLLRHEEKGKKEGRRGKSCTGRFGRDSQAGIGGEGEEG